MAPKAIVASELLPPMNMAQVMLAYFASVVACTNLHVASEGLA